MTQLEFITILQETMVLVLTMSAPMLVIGMLVGVIIGVFQSVTQIQEASLSFVPKLIATVVALIVFAPWILQVFLTEVNEIFRRMAAV